MEFAREIHESDTILKAEPIIGVKCALISKGHLLILITLRSEEKLIRLTYFILEIYIIVLKKSSCPCLVFISGPMLLKLLLILHPAIVVFCTFA